MLGCKGSFKVPSLISYILRKSCFLSDTLQGFNYNWAKQSLFGCFIELGLVLSKQTLDREE